MTANTLKEMKIGEVIEIKAIHENVTVHILKVEENSFYRVGTGERLWSGSTILWMYKTRELFR